MKCNFRIELLIIFATSFYDLIEADVKLAWINQKKNFISTRVPKHLLCHVLDNVKQQNKWEYWLEYFFTEKENWKTTPDNKNPSSLFFTFLLVKKNWASATIIKANREDADIC